MNRVVWFVLALLPCAVSAQSQIVREHSAVITVDASVGTGTPRRVSRDLVPAGARRFELPSMGPWECIARSEGGIVNVTCIVTQADGSLVASGAGVSREKRRAQLSLMFGRGETVIQWTINIRWRR